jgi:hypothetical protein
MAGTTRRNFLKLGVALGTYSALESLIAGCSTIDTAMRKVHNVPKNGVYKTRYGTVEFDPRPGSLDWVAADMVAEYADRITDQVMEILKLGSYPVPRPIRIVLLSDPWFQAVCSSKDEEEARSKAGCYSPEETGSEKVCYIKTETATPCWVGHEIAHRIIRKYYPTLSKEEQEERAQYVERNLPYSCSGCGSFQEGIL